MPFYMFEGRYSGAAFKAMIENPQDREAPARALVESVGGTLHNVFFAMGREDVIAIVEAPDDEAMAAGAMILAASGTFSGGRTTKLLTPAEAKDAMARAGAAAGTYRPATG
ncbi:MAG: GYD domain-containing protein [Alphaproteobacteria bacterium]|nr:MAG: GYD domain-containing protein [Alphaproteobacteria bacterium]